MFRQFVAALSALILLSGVAHADRVRLGFGLLLTNDFVGDGQDRWRTGSVTSSRVWGPEWTGAMPNSFGEIIELRLGGEIIAPANLQTPAAGDRPYAGALSIGVHSHFQKKNTEFALGADLVFIGSSTGLGSFQDTLHDVFGVARPSSGVLDNQISNQIRPTFVMEMGRSVDLNETTNLRPFVEARAGAETLVRAGFDLTFGQLGKGELLVRDPVTGHRYRTIKNDAWSGASFVIGADMAHVGSSVFLPTNRGLSTTDTRDRVRAGLHVQNKSGAGGFYGVTWLGEEFEGQGSGQVVGSVKFNLKF